MVSVAGHILTDRQLTDECDVVVVSGYGDADRLAEDKTAELALIRVHGAAELVPAALIDDGAKGPDLTWSASPTRRARAAAAPSRPSPRGSREN